MLSMPSGSSTEDSAQPKNAALPIFFSPLPKRTEERDLQEKNAFSPISTTEEGMTMLFSPEELKEAPPIYFSPEGRTMEVRLSAERKAPVFIESTLSGMETVLGSFW